MNRGTEEPSWASTRPGTPPMDETDAIYPYGYGKYAPSAITLPNLGHQHASPNSFNVSPRSPQFRTAGALPHMTGSPRSPQQDDALGFSM